MNMIGSYKKGEAQAAADTANAQMDYYAAQQNTEQTNRAVSAARINEQQQLGSVRAAYGASGVTMSGTAQAEVASQAGIMDSKIQGILSAGTFRTEQLGREEQAAEAGAQSASDLGMFGAATAGVQGLTGDVEMAMGARR